MKLKKPYRRFSQNKKGITLTLEEVIKLILVTIVIIIIVIPMGRFIWRMMLKSPSPDMMNSYKRLDSEIRDIEQGDVVTVPIKTKAGEPFHIRFYTKSDGYSRCKGNACMCLMRSSGVSFDCKIYKGTKGYVDFKLEDGNEINPGEVRHVTIRRDPEKIVIKISAASQLSAAGEKSKEGEATASIETGLGIEGMSKGTKAGSWQWVGKQIVVTPP